MCQLDPLDFETTQSYELDITVSDGIHSTSASFTITVEDANDNPPTGIPLSRTHTNASSEWQLWSDTATPHRSRAAAATTLFLLLPTTLLLLADISSDA